MVNQIITLVLFCNSLYGSVSNSDPAKVLKEAQSKLETCQSVSYQQIGYYPNPVGTLDTIRTGAVFFKNTDSSIAEDFILGNDNYQQVYIAGNYNQVSHSRQMVTLFQDGNSDLIENNIENSVTYKRSPMKLKNFMDWEYVTDTSFNQNRYFDYSRVIDKRMVDGYLVLTEQHIFINLETKNIERFERRNFYKGSLTQRIVITFEDYDFSENSSKLTYQLPEGYRSVLYGTEEKQELIALGVKAPSFEVKDLLGEIVNLDEYKGKKVLLNFSSIGCGYCHQAVQFFNEHNDLLPDNMVAFYVSMGDKKNRLVDYFEKIQPPYPVIPNGEQIGELYGASSTPNFILINEKGIVEKTVMGFDKDFLYGLNNSKANK